MARTDHPSIADSDYDLIRFRHKTTANLIHMIAGASSRQEWDEVLTISQELLKRKDNKTSAITHHKRALAFAGLGRHSEAINEAEQALCKHGSEKIHTALVALIGTQRRKISEAVGDLKI